MPKVITLKRGLDIRLDGGATRQEGCAVECVRPAVVALCPDDFPGLVPRLDVKVGDTVAVGDTLFHDKTCPDIRVVSPVAGSVNAIERGERRKILSVSITPDVNQPVAVATSPTLPSNRDGAERLLLESGIWAFLRQRPFGVVPRPGLTPRDIIISGFDSAPLAPDYEPLIAASLPKIEAAVSMLKLLTTGSVILTMREGSKLQSVNGSENVIVNGPHPAGNPGVQLANLCPVNKGDIVWTLDLPSLVRLGGYLLSGTVDFTTEVAVTGSEVTPTYLQTYIGADLRSLLTGRENTDNVHHRLIAGNVLTGIHESSDGYLRYPYTQVTVIAEGDDIEEFMGWASLSPRKMSVNRSFPGHFLKRLFSADARLHGGRRAMIMSGVYDDVIPMDIMVEYLIKACLSRNIERMEQLGIYEVLPEDIALCEYVDPSKLELQRILSEALDYAYKELN